jgi:hypothetical protein
MRNEEVIPRGIPVVERCYTTLYAFKFENFIIDGTFKILEAHYRDVVSFFVHFIENGKSYTIFLGNGEDDFKRTFGGREMLYRSAKQDEVAKAMLMGLE